MSEEIIKLLFISAIGAFSVFGVFMFMKEQREPKRTREVKTLSEFDIQALELGKKLLTDVYEASKKDKKIFFQNGYREYSAYEIPFAIQAIDRVLGKASGEETEEDKLFDEFIE